MKCKSTQRKCTISLSGRDILFANCHPVDFSGITLLELSAYMPYIYRARLPHYVLYIYIIIISSHNYWGGALRLEDPASETY